MAFRKITEGDMLGKGNVGRPDTPGVSTAEMQRIMDELPREVLAPAFNELAGQLEAETAAADIGAAAPEGVTAAPAGKLQAVLNGLRDLVKAHTDRADNPHGVTAAQAGAYSKAETDAAISAKVVELGAGDMAKSIYDPGNEQQPLLPRNGDGSNVTASFTEAEQDADIASGEKLSVLFGKIKKRFSVLASTVMLKSVFTQVGNPNLLDNSNFINPVNQRGVGSYTDTWKYCIDRWTLIGKYDVKAHTLTFQSDNAIERFGLTLSYMRQGIEGLNIGDKVTLSASAGGVTYSHTITLAADMQQAYNKGPFLFTVEYYSSTNVAWFGIGITSGSVALEWIKAEKGGITTPYVPKGYGAELAECQRYYLRIPNWQMVGSGYVDWEGKHIFIMMPTPSTMRIAPTAVAISGTAYCGDGTTSAYSGTPGAINRPGWVVLDLSGTFTQKNQTATFVMGNTPLELSSDL